MRLHHLEITAFGPFVETVSIDFDRLSDSGLFLLSGATGAGKSSVLDAVCFALYGAIPGDRNDAHRLRSDQAPPGLAPSVELDVTVSGRRFRIVRSPAWERPKKRGTGLTREPAKVTVSERRDGSWCALSSRLDEAGDLLSGLLGMNLDQFCQVALLPQGQFQAFLRADSAQRHRLLARLFRTGRFERVETWLRDRRSELRRASQAQLSEVADLVSRLSEAAAVEVPDDVVDLEALGSVPLARTWALGVYAITESALEHAGETADTCQDAAVLAAETWAEARDRAAARARALEALAARDRLAAAASQQEATVARLEAGRRALAVLPLAGLVDTRVAQWEAVRGAADAAIASATAMGVLVEELPVELDRLTQEVSELTVLLPAERRLTELHTEREHRATELQSVLRDSELVQAESSACGEQVVALRAELALATDASDLLAAAEAESLRLRAVADAHAELPRLRDDLALAIADHGAALTRRLDLRERLLDLRERRIAGMAAELAGSLAVGADCPVCGSTDHPHPAARAHAQLDAADERAAQKAVDDAQALEHALDLRVRDTGAALKTAETTAAAVRADELETVVRDAEARWAAAETATARRPVLSQRMAAAESRVATLAEDAARHRMRAVELTTVLDHLGRRLDELELQVSATRGEHASLSEAVRHVERKRALAQHAHLAQSQRQAADQALQDARRAFDEAARRAGFDNGPSARACELSTGELSALEDQVWQQREQVSAAEAVLAEPGVSELLASPPADPAPLELGHRRAAAALEQARSAHLLAQRRQARVGSLLNELEAALARWSPIRDQLELTTSVSTFTEGKAPDNRLQMRLSAYVLSYRLSQVVAAANARLAGMSDRRYSLEHVGRRGTGESRGGLSLVIRDDWSGESRDPATLSGGETFVVSLALALGLADVVAHEAGGADLATLFVDEGFGSLDAETLDDVLDILDTLRENGRAVGVVSHVAEMRDRIPTQLVVSKSRAGSTAAVSG